MLEAVGRRRRRRHPRTAEARRGRRPPDTGRGLGRAGSPGRERARVGCASEPDLSRRELRHVVLFAFKETATPAQLRAIEQAFAGLQPQIVEIKDFEWGTDVSVEQLADGYTHCFLVTFVSLPDRDTYLVHPAHQAFVAGIQPHVAKAMVIDYWARRR